MFPNCQSNNAKKLIRWNFDELATEKVIQKFFLFKHIGKDWQIRITKKGVWWCIQKVCNTKDNYVWFLCQFIASTLYDSLLIKLVSLPLYWWTQCNILQLNISYTYSPLEVSNIFWSLQKLYVVFNYKWLINS